MENLKTDSFLATVYHNRGIAKYHLNDYEGAFEDLSIAIELTPPHEKEKLSERYFHRGHIRVASSGTFKPDMSQTNS